MKRSKPLSPRPLRFEEAVSAILQPKPTREQLLDLQAKKQAIEGALAKVQQEIKKRESASRKWRR